MAQVPSVLLSALADEATFTPNAVEQFTAMAALGLEYYSLRFIDVGKGVKNAMLLTKPEIDAIKRLHAVYGLKVASIASPIGKVKLADIEDGTKNRYVPFKSYLAKDVRRACDLAHTFDTRLIRGFSFYPPRDADPALFMEEACDRLGRIAEVCDREGLTFGLEVEPNLVGQTGMLLAEIHRLVNSPALVLVFDAANLVAQGFSGASLVREWEAMKPGLGWVHIKDYRKVSAAMKGRHVDEASLANFVPVDRGSANHARILADLRTMLPALTKRLARRGVPGVFLDLEPHVRGGGQFGGTSGPDGMGIALRSLCTMLDRVKIGYHLRDFDDLLAARGLAKS
ncbi:MAG: sugar phosphate isomerase/epimerase [Planctomycetia bacterium]|nr:sugar phosphate isomerase/epimerase [Planctomycetia bacterium]